MSQTANICPYQRKKLPLYYRLGGMQPLTQMIATFFQHVLKDRELNFFFIQNVSDIHLHHQTVTHFVASQIGGPNLYKGDDMKKTHGHMDIKTNHFETFVGHLRQACRDNKFTEQQIEQLITILAPFGDDVCKNENNPVVPKCPKKQ